jgi:dihydrolipoamide dehydrogenase
MSEAFDVAVIGAGPAGYVCAIRAAQLGFKVVLVDKRKELGGTCLNVGCIPSKAMLESSHLYDKMTHGDLAKHGLAVKGVELNLAAMQARKTAVVKQLTDGIGMLMRKNRVTVKNGFARIGKAGLIVVEGEEIPAKHIVIAIGSTPVELPFAKFDHQTILDSTDTLALEKVPEHLIVVGAGVIGLEMGSVWARLGAKVTVVDVADRPVAVMDADLGRESQKIFEKQGMAFVLGAKVKDVKADGGKALLTVEKADGKTETLKGDKVLIAVGRKPATAGMGLDESGIVMSDRGVILVDDHYQTSVPGVYAIGDCIPGAMLAHKGEEEGAALAELLAGQKPHVNYNAIPSVVYTAPELAGVGLTEAEARDRLGNDNVRVGKFKFAANGRALAVDESAGFVKVVAHAETDEVLGVHIIGHNASEMIAEAAVLMEFKGSAEDLARTCHAHPTMSEAVKEAALAVAGRALHA